MLLDGTCTSIAMLLLVPVQFLLHSRSKDSFSNLTHLDIVQSLSLIPSPRLRTALGLKLVHVPLTCNNECGHEILLHQGAYASLSELSNDTKRLSFSHPEHGESVQDATTLKTDFIIAKRRTDRVVETIYQQSCMNGFSVPLLSYEAEIRRLGSIFDSKILIHDPFIVQLTLSDTSPPHLRDQDRARSEDMASIQEPWYRPIVPCL
jgi:hypothetical protein